MDVYQNICDGVYDNKLPFLVPQDVLDNVKLPDDFGPVESLVDIERAKTKINQLKDEMKKSYRQKYSKEEARLLEQFWIDVAKEFRAERFPFNKWQKLCSMAWDLGHSAGLSEVLCWVGELVPLLED